MTSSAILASTAAIKSKRGKLGGDGYSSLSVSENTVDQQQPIMLKKSGLNLLDEQHWPEEWRPLLERLNKIGHSRCFLQWLFLPPDQRAQTPRPVQNDELELTVGLKDQKVETIVRMLDYGVIRWHNAEYATIDGMMRFLGSPELWPHLQRIVFETTSYPLLSQMGTITIHHWKPLHVLRELKFAVSAIDATDIMYFTTRPAEVQLLQGLLTQSRASSKKIRPMFPFVTYGDDLFEKTPTKYYRYKETSNGVKKEDVYLPMNQSKAQDSVQLLTSGWLSKEHCYWHKSVLRGCLILTHPYLPSEMELIRTLRKISYICHNVMILLVTPTLVDELIRHELFKHVQIVRCHDGD